MLQGILALVRQIHQEFTFDPTATTVTTPLSVVFRSRRGVCQDFAHLILGCLRSLGLSARYVSGYLETTVPAGMDRLVGADASHAWVSAFIPGFGWVDVDPTNNLLVADRHITVAWGRDYSDVSPVRGVVVGKRPALVGRRCRRGPGRIAAMSFGEPDPDREENRENPVPAITFRSRR